MTCDLLDLPCPLREDLARIAADRDHWRERAERAEALSPAAARLARAVVARIRLGQSVGESPWTDRAWTEGWNAAWREEAAAEAEVLATWGSQP